jgi:hypothetical protein
LMTAGPPKSDLKVFRGPFPCPDCRDLLTDKGKGGSPDGIRTRDFRRERAAS